MPLFNRAVVRLEPRKDADDHHRPDQDRPRLYRDAERRVRRQFRIRSFASTTHGRDRDPDHRRSSDHALPVSPQTDSPAILLSQIALWRWWRARPDIHVVWRTHMTILLVLGLFAGLYIFWLAITLAVHALPLYVGVATGFWLHSHGHGYLPRSLAVSLPVSLTLSVGRLPLRRGPIADLAPRYRLAVRFCRPALQAFKRSAHRRTRLGAPGCRSPL